MGNLPEQRLTSDSESQCGCGGWGGVGASVEWGPVWPGSSWGVGARVDMGARMAWECIWAAMLLEPNLRRVQSLQEAINHRSISRVSDGRSGQGAAHSVVDETLQLAGPQERPARCISYYLFSETMSLPAFRVADSCVSCHR